MSYRWDQQADERFWCEITDRRDLGSDPKCPQRRENGKPDWSYNLINEVWPGDVVFHYSTRAQRIEGASVKRHPATSVRLALQIRLATNSLRSDLNA
jgi:hypothetical protein